MTNQEASNTLALHARYWVDPSSPTLAALRHAIKMLSEAEGEKPRNPDLLALGHPGFSSGNTGWIYVKDGRPPKDTPFLAGVWEEDNTEWIHICILESSFLYVIVDSNYRYAAPYTITDLQFWKPIPRLPKLPEE